MRAQSSLSWDLLLHLRLPFQLLLSPIFLWGWLLSGGGWSASIALAFVCFHICLYGGATAFNSAYDRDVGPVGGMANPPPAPRLLLPFSILMKSIGWLMALLVNPLVFGIYGMFFGLSVVYSHPRVRLKARPIASLLVIAFGQGALAFLAAWAAATGGLQSAANLIGILGAAAASLVVVGLYPLTQLFQIEEDRARGDRTIAVAWGPGASFGVSLACLVSGGGLLVGVLAVRFGFVDAVLVGLGLTVELAAIATWSHSFDSRLIMSNYRRVMRLNVVCASGLAAYLLFRLVNP